MALALYRKYRPKTFDELMGQSPVRTTLTEALKQGRLSHAYLFSGPRGTGKTSTARLIAKAIQCPERLDSGQACGQCDICAMNAKGDLVDLIEIDAASNRGIDEIRDLREKIRFAPSYAKAKVYIIDEVHMLTKEAFNALLKSLEEPPEHVYFILATTEIHKIPETILSRCQRYDFKRVRIDAIVERLKHIADNEKIAFQPEALELIAKHADGGMRDAISLLEQLSSEELSAELVQERLGLTSHQSCKDLFVALSETSTQKGLAIIEELHKEGYNLQQFTLSFLGHLRAKLHEAIEANDHHLVSKLLSWTELFDEAWIKLKRASIAQLPLEIAVIRATRTLQSAEEVPTQAPSQERPAPVQAAPSGPQIEREHKNVRPIPTQQKPGELMQLQAIQKQMPAVIKAIKNPSLRLSFQTGKLTEQKEDRLHFVFNTRFHYEKVHLAESIVDVEAALQDILKSPFKVEVEFDEGQMNPSPKPTQKPVDTMGWETIEEPV